MVLLESEKQHDDLLVGDFIDSFHNLTFKDSMLLTWAKAYCPVTFIFKESDKISQLYLLLYSTLCDIPNYAVLLFILL